MNNSNQTALTLSKIYLENKEATCVYTFADNTLRVYRVALYCRDESNVIICHPEYSQMKSLFDMAVKCLMTLPVSQVFNNNRTGIPSKYFLGITYSDNQSWYYSDDMDDPEIECYPCRLPRTRPGETDPLFFALFQVMFDCLSNEQKAYVQELIRQES